MARLDMTNPVSWETVVLSENDDVTATAVVTADTQIFAATSRGLYSSTDGVNWQVVGWDQACRDRNQPPLMSLGMEHLVLQDDDDRTMDLLVFGTVEGPWVYRMP